MYIYIYIHIQFEFKSASDSDSRSEALPVGLGILSPETRAVLVHVGLPNSPSLLRLVNLNTDDSPRDFRCPDGENARTVDSHKLLHFFSET